MRYDIEIYLYLLKENVCMTVLGHKQQALLDIANSRKRVFVSDALGLYPNTKQAQMALKSLEILGYLKFIIPKQGIEYWVPKDEPTAIRA